MLNVQTYQTSHSKNQNQIEKKLLQEFICNMLNYIRFLIPLNMLTIKKINFLYHV